MTAAQGFCFRVIEPIKVDRPPFLSFSSLSQVKKCPKSWVLSHASFPEIGAYPHRVSVASLNGQLVHLLLQEFGKSLGKSNNHASDRGWIERVRRDFPVRTIARVGRRQMIKALEGNPRVDVRSLASRISVDAAIAKFKKLALISYSNAACSHVTGVQKTVTPVAMSSGGQAIVPVPALLAEHWIEVHQPSLAGRVDLIITSVEGDSVIDFKTGEASDLHKSQVDFYALLWWLATGRRIASRTVVYSPEDRVEYGPLEEEALRELLHTYETQSKAVLSEMSLDAHARPGIESCEYCYEKHLCGEYWDSSRTADLRWILGRAVDCEKVVWRDIELDLSGTTLTGNMLTTSFENNGKTARLECLVPSKFMASRREGDTKLRIVGVALKKTPNTVRVLWSRDSEAYWM